MEMHELVELAMPWWQFVLHGAASYIGLLLLTRLAGKRAFGEMSPFDIVVLMIVGGAFRSALVGSDTSLLGPLISVGTILALDKALAQLSARSHAFDVLLGGREVLIARAGQLISHQLKRHGISEDAFSRELRRKQIASVERVDAAYLEANGRISVFKRGGS
jgi:uncharacterized membrane protein YcaP (DUF421 family)